MSGKKQDNGFGRDDMAVLLGGGLPERLMRPQVPVAKTNKPRKDVADMSTQETAAWLLQQQQQKKGKETIQRHRTTKVRKYHELLLEEPQNMTMTTTHQSKEDDRSDSDSYKDNEREKDTQVVPVLTRRRRRPSTSSSSSESSAPPRRQRQDSSSSDSDSEEEARRQRVLQRRRQHERSPSPIDEVSSTEGTTPQFTALESLPKAPIQKVMQSNPNATRSQAESSSSNSSSSSSSSDSSSEDSSSDEEDEEVRAKPIFVPRHKRGVIKSAEELAEEEKVVESKRKKLEEKRMKESRAMVQKVLLDASKQVGSNEDAFEGITGARNSVPDDDDHDNEEEYDKWEVRELERLVYELDMEDARMKEARERERRRNMTDEEIMKERMESGSSRDKEESNRAGQRYFHRGAFYMDESEWDESDVRHKAEEYAAAATGADKIDKKALPKVMQVKNFGRANQNLKYQGLAAEDTTDKQMKMLPILGPKRKQNQL
jgi:microfibrillar-associated protein 1